MSSYVTGSAVVGPNLSITVFGVLAAPVMGLVILVGLATLVALFAGRERARWARLILGDLLSALRQVLNTLRRGGDR